jgi:hypothetical protein
MQPSIFQRVRVRPVASYSLSLVFAGVAGSVFGGLRRNGGPTSSVAVPANTTTAGVEYTTVNTTLECVAAPSHAPTGPIAFLGGGTTNGDFGCKKRKMLPKKSHQVNTPQRERTPMKRKRYSSEKSEVPFLRLRCS